MIADKYPVLHQRFRVYADGEVEVGDHLVIRHRARDGKRQVAAPAMRAHNRSRFAGLSDIPRGIDQNWQAQHDCANHAPGGDA